MRYKIVNDKTIEKLIAFLDKLQLHYVEKGNNKLMKYCQGVINDLINSDEMYDSQEEAENKIKEIQEKYEEYYFEEDLFTIIENLSEQELMKLYKFVGSIVKEINPSEKTKDKKVKLTNEEKFEIYYKQREDKKQEKNKKSLDKIMKTLGLTPPKNNK